MLDVGLCIAVKDEERNILGCLAPIVDAFAEVVVIDTGSSDATRELLRDGLGIEAIETRLDPRECCSLAAVRNAGFDRLTTPWLMTLDADERLDADELRTLLALDDDGLPDGLFCGWDTDCGDGVVIEDYKCSLFRASHRHHGRIHDTVQPSLRAAGGSASWTPLLRIRHLPDPALGERKEAWYAWRLACAMRLQPDWLRYHWFAGYAAYRQGRVAEAEPLLRLLHERRPPRFPVESLDASMVLAAIRAQRGDRAGAERAIEDARRYRRTVADDFEVRVNFRLESWLERAAEHAARGALDMIVPYPFPY
jgi:glycosyltransferase involved in cell wall biosynthesis